LGIPNEMEGSHSDKIGSDKAPQRTWEEADNKGSWWFAWKISQTQYYLSIASDVNNILVTIVKTLFINLHGILIMVMILR